MLQTVFKNVFQNKNNLILNYNLKYEIIYTTFLIYIGKSVLILILILLYFISNNKLYMNNKL